MWMEDEDEDEEQDEQVEEKIEFHLFSIQIDLV